MKSGLSDPRNGFNDDEALTEEGIQKLEEVRNLILGPPINLMFFYLVIFFNTNFCFVEQSLGK